MRYTLYAGSYFGIPVRIHFTFPLILLVFGAEAWRVGGPVEAARAVVLILAVFVCVVLHEFGHSLQVRRYGIRVRDVVLLPIGGMARAERIPEKPWQEIVVAISGPAVNFVLAAVVYGIVKISGRPLDLESDLLTNLLVINLVLGAFNLIPAYPMDGGRILRGILALRLPYLRATRWAKNIGQMIALGFVVLGFVENTFILLPIIAVFIYFGAINEEKVIRQRFEMAHRQSVEPDRSGETESGQRES
jgi:stage IV sporulation protein FB